jgi:hypothetical protein
LLIAKRIVSPVFFKKVEGFCLHDIAKVRMLFYRARSASGIRNAPSRAGG